MSISIKRLDQLQRVDDVLQSLRKHAEGDTTDEWRMVYLDNARLPNVTEHQFRACLKSLSDRGHYKVVDGWAWGEVKTENKVMTLNYDAKSRLSVQRQFDDYRKSINATPFKLSKAQLLMIEDGASFVAFITDADRKQSWIDNPPKAQALFVEKREDSPEVAAFRARVEAEKATKKQPKIERQPKTPKATAPTGSFALRDWAKEMKIDPRHARAAARKVKAEIVALQVSGMKYVFPATAKTKVAALITSTLATMATGERKPRGERKSKTKVPTYASTLAALIKGGMSKTKAEKQARAEFPITTSSKANKTRPTPFKDAEHRNIIEKKQKTKIKEVAPTKKSKKPVSKKR